MTDYLLKVIEDLTINASRLGFWVQIAPYDECQIQSETDTLSFLLKEHGEQSCSEGKVRQTSYVTAI